MKRVTISDVAEYAGVSKSTVSHVINQTRFVEEDTKQRVLEVIETLGYRPSSVARSMVSKRTKTAGLLVSDVGNPFYSEVILGVEETARTQDYNIFLCNTSYNIQRGMELIHSLIDKMVDGVLLMSSSMSMELVHELHKHRIPAVVMDWESNKVNGKAASISIRFSDGIREAVNYLYELGHRRFAHVSGPLQLWTACRRRDDFLNALEDCEIPPCEASIIEGNLRIDGGREAMGAIMELDQRPTAIFAANDLTALGLLWAANDYGLQIPEDMSLIGLDNIKLASQVTPPLTSVSLPRFEIGSLAMTLLLDLISLSENDHLDYSTLNKTVTTNLVIRKSTSKPPVYSHQIQ
jgi:LacI family transcriptional regulator